MSIKATRTTALWWARCPTRLPALGEVRIAVTVSGLSPGDVKKRSGWQGRSTMSYPRVIPHSDGAGTIDAVGPESPRTGSASTCGATGAQSYRPFVSPPNTSWYPAA